MPKVWATHRLADPRLGWVSLDRVAAQWARSSLRRRGRQAAGVWKRGARARSVSVMVTAAWNGRVIAESDSTVVVESTHYFPVESVAAECLRDSDHTTHCHWKGDASYYHVVVDGETNENAAWFYAEPLEAAREIVGHVAFWKGVEVT